MEPNARKNNDEGKNHQSGFQNITSWGLRINQGPLSCYSIKTGDFPNTLRIRGTHRTGVATGGSAESDPAKSFNLGKSPYDEVLE